MKKTEEIKLGNFGWNPSSKLIRSYINLAEKKENSLRTKIEGSDISKKNKKILMDFYENCIVRGLSKPTILHYLQVLSKISKTLNKDFGQATFQDIERVLVGIEGVGYNERTKNNYKIILRKFFKWLGKMEIARQIRIKKIRNVCSRLPEDLLTKQEIEKIIEAAENVRDKAIIAVLYESGCRIGELLKLKIKDIKFDEYGVVLLVNGMKNQREVRIVESVPALKQWINEHPFGNDSEAFLWVSKNRNKTLSHVGIRQIIRKLTKKSNLKKPVHPHAFRTARAVYLVKCGLNDTILRKYFGWAYISGSVPRDFFLLCSDNEVDEAILKNVYGITKKKNKKNDTVLLKGFGWDSSSELLKAYIDLAKNQKKRKKIRGEEKQEIKDKSSK